MWPLHISTLANWPTWTNNWNKKNRGCVTLTTNAITQRLILYLLFNAFRNAVRACMCDCRRQNVFWSAIRKIMDSNNYNHNVRCEVSVSFVVSVCRVSTCVVLSVLLMPIADTDILVGDFAWKYLYKAGLWYTHYSVRQNNKRVTRCLPDPSPLKSSE